MVSDSYLAVLCTHYTVRSEHGRYKNCISTQLVLLHPVVFLTRMEIERLAVAGCSQRERDGKCSISLSLSLTLLCE